MMLAMLRRQAQQWRKEDGAGHYRGGHSSSSGYFDPGTGWRIRWGRHRTRGRGDQVYQSSVRATPTPRKQQVRGSGACIFLIVAATILRSFFL